MVDHNYYCQLGTEKFLPFLLIIFHQGILQGHIRNGCFFDSLFLSVTDIISTELFPVLEMPPYCANTISKQGYEEESLDMVRIFAIYKS